MNTEAIILKALRKSAGMTVEDTAANVAKYMEIASEIEGDGNQSSPGLVKIPTSSGATDTYSNVRVSPHVPSSGTSTLVATNLQPGQRLVYTDGESVGDREWRTVQDILDGLNVEAPATMDIVPVGGDKPIRMTRKVMAPPSPEMGFVKLMYLVEGEHPENCPSVVLSTADEVLDVAQAVRDIIAQAQNMFGAVQRGPIAARPPTIPKGHNRIESGQGGGASMGVPAEAYNKFTKGWQ